MNLASRKWWVLSWRKDTNINQGWDQSFLKISRRQLTLRRRRYITWIGRMILWKIWTRVLSIGFNWQERTLTQFSISTTIASRTRGTTIRNFSIRQVVVSRTIHRDIEMRRVQGASKDIKYSSNKVHNNRLMFYCSRMDCSRVGVNLQTQPKSKINLSSVIIVPKAEEASSLSNQPDNRSQLKIIFKIRQSENRRPRVQWMQIARKSGVLSLVPPSRRWMKNHYLIPNQ